MFNDDRRKNASFIFQRMKRLYPTFETPDEVDIQAWVEILEGYSQTEILEGLKNYRKCVPYDKAPNPASFKDYLPAKHKPVAEITASQAKGDLAWEQMNSDIEAGSCRHNLYVYRMAEKIVLGEWLLEYMPLEVVRKMSYASRLKAATEKGLVYQFADALTQASQRMFGRDYEFQSANEIEANKERCGTVNNDAAKTLAAHWTQGA